MVPIRAAMERHPVAIFLITVGKSSDETQNEDLTSQTSQETQPHLVNVGK